MDGNKNGTSSSWTETPVGKKVQAKLSEERTLQALEHLLSRIDTLEKAVEKLTTLMDQGPGLMAMVGDMADETFRQADANGVNIDARLKNALAIAEKLTAPAMVEKLDNLLTLTKQGPGLVAMVGDMADERFRQADANGVNIDARLKNALAIAEKLTAPAMVEKLDNLLVLTDQAPGLAAMVADMADEAYRNADTYGINIDQRLGAALEIAEKLTAPAMVEKLNALLNFSDQMPGLVAMTVDMVDEGMKNVMEQGFDPSTLIEVASTANNALTQASSEPPAKVGGIFGLLRTLKDPDRQKGLGFLMNFLKHFGRNL